jgi:DNA polymerase-3 subunit epsilon
VRYRIDASHRTKHGALLDAELLAEVYIELIEARQASLVLLENAGSSERAPQRIGASRQRPAPLASRVTAEELDAHRTFIATMGEKALWNEYQPVAAAAETVLPVLPVITAPEPTAAQAVAAPA